MENEDFMRIEWVACVEVMSSIYKYTGEVGMTERGPRPLGDGIHAHNKVTPTNVGPTTYWNNCMAVVTDVFFSFPSIKQY